MSQQSSDVNPKSSLTEQGSTLWEAMGKLNEIQTQEKIALDNGDIELFQELLKQQAEAWEIVYGQAARLIATGKAPPDRQADCYRQSSPGCDSAPGGYTKYPP